MDALRRASAPLFYGLGFIVIIAIVLLQKGVAIDPLHRFLAVVDLPLLMFGMILGGSTLVASLSKGTPSTKLTVAIFLPLALLFALFAYLNFGLPFAAEF